MMRHRAVITDQQAPDAAWQAAGPRLSSNTAENTAQFRTFQTTVTMRASQIAVTSVWTRLPK